MSTRGLMGWKGNLGSPASCALLVGLLASAAPAGAAQIDLTNCQPKQVRICAYDPGLGDVATKASRWELQGHHIYSAMGETHHFTCTANCKFWITEHCKDGKCSDCGPGNGGRWLDHSWGKGAYQLISLEKNSSNNYKSADLQKADAGAQCP